ncbi:hypothetical protein LKO27_12750 [Tessaracoccus sp. OS52]|uniref:hypothetical protein n=1 Tax=Tessaracoccus sp. OS52 TaxID=2886691 RepID=UPI001D126B5D|nr:hypothetical protein [Tessaracoccus sp. OS52]MCC2594276.1 hypothetical protein [Tessaracoccus sp. OS52]
MRVSRRALLGVVSVAGLWGLGACGPEEDLEPLEALTSDPMADEQLLDLELVSSESRGYRTTMGKPEYAELTHHFQIIDDDVLTRAVTAAEDAGWVGEAPINEALRTWRGAKDSPRRTCAITVTDDGLLLVKLTNLETP